MEGAAHTIVGTALQSCDAYIEISVGSDCDDRRLGCAVANLSARLRDIRGRDEDHLRLEHVQQPRRPFWRSDCEHVVPVSRELTRQLWLRNPMYQHDPQRTRDRVQTSNTLIEHAAIVDTTCEPGVRAT